MLRGTFYAKLLIFTTISVVIDAVPSNLDAGNACIVQYLKDKNKLEADFPISANLPTAECRLVMPIIMRVFESALCAKLQETESIKAECVMEEFKNEDALEFMLIQEIIVMTKHMDENDMRQRLEEVREKLRNIFEKTAQTCDSDPTYGGLFDDVLEIKNESLAVLRQNYCFTKFVIESKLIDVKNVDVNPKKISTSDIDCQAMIKERKTEREKKLLETLRNRKLTDEQVQCIMDKFQIERAFDSNLALEVIDQLDVALEVRRKNRENIAKQLENFIRAIFICAGRSMNSSQGFAHNPISILQY